MFIFEGLGNNIFDGNIQFLTAVIWIFFANFIQEFFNLQEQI